MELPAGLEEGGSGCRARWGHTQEWGRRSISAHPQKAAIKIIIIIMIIAVISQDQVRRQKPYQ